MSEHGLAPPPAVSGVRRLLYVVLGGVFVGLAVLGILLPVLPTTPFLLLASFFFVRSSHRLNARLLRSRVFGGLLRDWQKHRGVRPRVKVTAVIVLLAAVATSALLTDLPPALLIALLALGAVGLVVVLRLPLIRAESEQPAAQAQQPQEERVSA